MWVGPPLSFWKTILPFLIEEERREDHGLLKGGIIITNLLLETLIPKGQLLEWSRESEALFPSEAAIGIVQGSQARKLQEAPCA